MLSNITCTENEDLLLFWKHIPVPSLLCLGLLCWVWWRGPGEDCLQLWTRAVCLPLPRYQEVLRGQVAGQTGLEGTNFRCRSRLKIERLRKPGLQKYVR